MVYAMTSPGTQTRIARRFAVLALSVLLLSLSPFAANGSAQTKKREAARVYEDRDGYEVLSVLLNALSVTRKNETVRIDPRMASGKGVAEIKAQCSGIPAEFQAASEDFDKKVETRFLLRRGFSLAKSYALLHARVKTDATWAETQEEARKRFGSGIYHVAAVGFDDKRTRAIAFVEYICGNLCGDSIFYFLRKSEKGWVQAPEVQREVHSCGRIY
jgi:hypothetical protein